MATMIPRQVIPDITTNGIIENSTAGAAAAHHAANHLFCVPAPPYRVEDMCLMLFLVTFVIESLLIWKWYNTPDNSVHMNRFQTLMVHVSGIIWMLTLFGVVPHYVAMANKVMMPFNTFAFAVFLARYAAVWKRRILGDLDDSPTPKSLAATTSFSSTGAPPPYLHKQ